MPGSVKLNTPGPPTQYAIDRLRILTNCPVNETDVVSFTRNLSTPKLLEILFKAVAGDYVSGPSALSVNICRLQSDPMTGMLSLVDETQENRTVLTIFVVILFVILGYLIYKKQNNDT